VPHPGGASVHVTVVYATAHLQDVVLVTVHPGATIADAVTASGLLQAHGLDRTGLSFGVAGRQRKPADAVRHGDRIELLRQLAADAKEARRQRAARAKIARN
jgi:putative ubiquitin-RnfH superfamily antitoxin RatB of RatAB toxin-antitoxin module